MKHNNTNISKVISENIKDLFSRIFYTTGILILYRIMVHIPIPFTRPEVALEYLERNSGGLAGAFDMFSGGALGRLGIATLGLAPYISSSIMIQLLTGFMPHFVELRKHGGEVGRKTLNAYTKYLTLLLGVLQALSVAKFLEMMRSHKSNLNAVIYPGWEFKILVVISCVTATFFLVWLAERISNSGIGNGSSMVIYTGIVANLPASAARTYNVMKEGLANNFLIWLAIGAICALIVFVVVIEKSFRKVNVSYPGGRGFANSNYSYMPMKLNQNGILPAVFASTMLGLPQSLLQFFSSSNSKVVLFLINALNHGNTFFMVFFILLIYYFSFMYTPLTFNTEETASEMQKNGAFIAGYRPGKTTVKFFDDLLERLTFLGATYISIVCIVPELVTHFLGLQFAFGGTSILICVGVSIDLVNAVKVRLAGEYSKLIEKPWMQGIQHKRNKF